MAQFLMHPLLWSIQLYRGSFGTDHVGHIEETFVVNMFVIAQGVHIVKDQCCRFFFSLTQTN